MVQDNNNRPKKSTGPDGMTPGEKKGMWATLVLGTLGIGTIIVAFYRDIMKPPEKPEQPKAALKAQPDPFAGKAQEKGVAAEPEKPEDIKTFMERIAKKLPSGWELKLTPEPDWDKGNPIRYFRFGMTTTSEDTALIVPGKTLNNAVIIEFDTRNGKVTATHFYPREDFTGEALKVPRPKVEPAEESLAIIRAWKRGLPPRDYLGLRRRIEEGRDIVLDGYPYTKLPEPLPILNVQPKGDGKGGMGR